MSQLHNFTQIILHRNSIRDISKQIAFITYYIIYIYTHFCTVGYEITEGNVK